MLPEIDPSNPDPINEQIADWIRQNIHSGKWPNNHQLLSESDLSKKLKVSRGTIRKAIELLLDEHLLELVKDQDLSRYIL